MTRNKKNVRFIRKGGRVIPIRKRGISGNVAGITAAGAGALGGMYASGRMYHAAKRIAKTAPRKSYWLNRAAKLGKYGSVFGAGLLFSKHIGSLDRKIVADEKRGINIGSKSKSTAGLLATGVLGYAGYRFGKRFEKAGKMGLNLLRRKNWSKIKTMKGL